MTATTSKIRPPLNGVDTPTLFATLDAVRANPELAKFQFRATNRWVSGTHNRGTIRGFYGAGQEDSTRTADFVYDADHPAVLVGTGNGPTPVEFLLHAIAACLPVNAPIKEQARGTGPQLHATQLGPLVEPVLRQQVTGVQGERPLGVTPLRRGLERVDIYPEVIRLQAEQFVPQLHPPPGQRPPREVQRLG